MCNPGDTLYVYVGGELGYNGGGLSIMNSELAESFQGTPPCYSEPDFSGNILGPYYTDYSNWNGAGGTDVRFEYGGEDGSQNLASRIITAGGGFENERSSATSPLVKQAIACSALDKPSLTASCFPSFIPALIFLPS